MAEECVSYILDVDDSVATNGKLLPKTLKSQESGEEGAKAMH